MIENVAPWIVYIIIGAIWYYRKGYLPDKRNALLHKIKLLYENNAEIRNVFVSFENEQKSAKQNHPQFQLFEKGFFTSEGILNSNVEVFGIAVFVFYEYQLNDFKENLLRRIKKMESTKKGKSE